MARDRVYINSNYRSEIDEMKDSDILGFSIVENKDSFLLAVAMGVDSPETVKRAIFRPTGKKESSAAMPPGLFLIYSFSFCLPLTQMSG